MEINISNLKKKYGDKTAVDIFDFNVPKGQIIGLLGNNCSGKTTILRLMLDLTEANEGSVCMTFDTPTESSTDATLKIDPSESEEWKRYTGAYIDESFLIDFLTPGQEEFQVPDHTGGVFRLHRPCMRHDERADTGTHRQL